MGLSLGELRKLYPWLDKEAAIPTSYAAMPAWLLGAYSPSRDVIMINPTTKTSELGSLVGHEKAHKGLGRYDRTTQGRGTWSQLLARLEPAESRPRLTGEMGPWEHPMTLPWEKKGYKREEGIEEALIRSIFPSHVGPVTWKSFDERVVENPDKYLTGEQQALVGHLKRFFKGGPNALWSGVGEDREPGQAFRYLFNRITTQGQDKWLDEQVVKEREAGYDLAGYIDKYGYPEKYFAGEEHLPDEFKLPHHITFSDESVYHSDKTPGGKWTLEKDGRWHYAPSTFVLSQHPEGELREYFEKYAPDDVLDLPKSEEDLTTRPLYPNSAPPMWSELY